MPDNLTYFTYLFYEWPYIIAMSIAVYLSFEYWRFPDLTVESSFTAGMVGVYWALTQTKLDPHLSFFLFLVFIPLIYSLLTWGLTLLSLPSLFAGLLVLLGTYTINFLANGSDIAQGGFLVDSNRSLPAYLRSGKFNPVDKGFFISIAIAISIVVVLHFFSKTVLAVKLHMSRRALDPLVPVAADINYYLYLFIGMWIYNTVAFLGGMGFALGSDISAVGFLGAITPGLTCTFIVKGIREYISVPSRRISRSKNVNRFSKAALQKSDSLTFVLIVLVLLSAVITLLRFEVRDLVKGRVGLLNAVTAIGTVVVWVVISLIARALGKRVGYAKPVN